MLPPAPTTPIARASTKHSTTTPLNPQSHTSELIEEPLRSAELGANLRGKIFTEGAATTPHSATNLAEHFSAPWRPTLREVAAFCRCGAWRLYVDAGKTDEKQAFALIQAAVAAFTSSSTASVFLPLRRVFDQSFDGYFGYDDKSKAQRTEASGNDLKPDVIMHAADVATNVGRKRWSIVQLLLDLKSRMSSKTARVRFYSKLLKNTIIFQDQYGYRRSHVVGASLYGNFMTHYVFDRSGVTISNSFDISKVPERFLRCIAGFLVLDEARLGFRSPDTPDFFKITFDSTEYIVQRAPFVVPAFDRLLGRGTTCWRAKWANKKDRPEGWASEEDEEWPLVLKSSWQYVVRREEGSYLKELENEPGVPDLVSYRKNAVKINGKDVELTTDFARGNFRMGPQHSFGCSSGARGPKRSPAPSAEEGDAVGMAAGKANKSRCLNSEPSRRSRLSDKSRDDQKLAHSADYVPKANFLSGYLARVEHLTLMMYAGQPYSPKATQEQLWAAISVAIATVNRLYQRNIIHRDISAGNIVIPDGASFRNKKNKWGAVIDFDFASGTDSEPSGSPERTGTLSHIAYLLAKRDIYSTAHHVWFDVESIFWFHYLACLRADLPDKYQEISKLTMDDAASQKMELYSEVANYRNDHANGAMGRSWALLDRFATFLRPSDQAAISEVLRYGLTRTMTPKGAVLGAPAKDSRFALEKATVWDRTTELLRMFVEEIAKHAKWSDFRRDFDLKFGPLITSSDH